MNPLPLHYIDQFETTSYTIINIFLAGWCRKMCLIPYYNINANFSLKNK